ncbi:MAG: hypothetical protein U0893_20930 [Chloroflexota bacterium]
MHDVRVVTDHEVRAGRHELRRPTALGARERAVVAAPVHQHDPDVRERCETVQIVSEGILTQEVAAAAR